MCVCLLTCAVSETDLGGYIALPFLPKQESCFRSYDQLSLQTNTDMKHALQFPPYVQFLASSCLQKMFHVNWHRISYFHPPGGYQELLEYMNLKFVITDSSRIAFQNELIDDQFFC